MQHSEDTAAKQCVCVCVPGLSTCGCAVAGGVVGREMGMAAGEGEGSPRGFQGKVDLHSVYRTSCPPSLLRLRSNGTLHVIVDCDFEITEVCCKLILAQASSKQRLQAWPSSQRSLVTGSAGSKWLSLKRGGKGAQRHSQSPRGKEVGGKNRVQTTGQSGKAP